MGILDRILGRDEPQVPNRTGARDPDDAAVERYKYLLRTAPPDAIEQAHAEAFANLSPEQRRQVLTELSDEVPEWERPTSAEPGALARLATRAEMRKPGTMERTFGGGSGMGGLFAGTLLASIAGSFIGTSIASAMLSDAYGDGYADGEADSAQDSADPGEEGADTGAEGDLGGGDFGSGDFGGGDFGGGDFGI
jgi:hypothetical protein